MYQTLHSDDFFNPSNNPRRQALLLSHSTEKKSEPIQDEHLVRVFTASKWNLELTLKDSPFLQVLSDFQSSGSLRKEVSAVWTSPLMLELKKDP